MHPNAQMSVRLSSVWPRACSGLTYAAVPRITPCNVPLTRVGELERLVPAGSGANTLASPKSSTLTFPSAVTLMFGGFKSRWTMLFSCGASCRCNDVTGCVIADRSG
jgi:hypothetical protein